MEINWKKVTLVLSCLLLIVLVSRYYLYLHNIDLSFNLWRDNRCDWASTDECISLKDLYVQSMDAVEKILIFIIPISILIGYTIKEL